MAYTSGAGNPSMPIPVEPSVLSTYVHHDNTEILIDVPWKNCRMTYCYLSILEPNAVTSAGGAIDVELNAAGGGDLYAITIGASAASGSQIAGVLDSTSGAANRKNLDRDDTNRDKINLEVTIGDSNGWDGMLYMYFEPEPQV